MAIGKYTASAIAATGIDFLVFGATSYIGYSPAVCTAFGRIAGAVSSFIMHQQWVFQHDKNAKFTQLLVHYLGSNLAGLLLSVYGVVLLHDFFKLPPLAARVLTAVIVWYATYLFYKLYVYRDKNTEKTHI